MTLRIGSVCTGYAGLDGAIQTVIDGELAWVADPDPGAAAILTHHHPDVPNLGDITTVDWADVKPVDVLCAGFPCQDVSAAGKRSGIGKGTRTGIWAQIAEAIGVLRPHLVILENVPGLLAPLPMEEPNDRCVCGWPRGWRGLHHDSNTERGVLNPRGHRDDNQGEGGPGVDALNLRRLDTPLAAGDGTVGRGDLLARLRPGSGEIPHPHRPAPEVEGRAGRGSDEDGGNPNFSGAVRSGISLDAGGAGTVLDPAAESQGAEPEGPDLPGPAGFAAADCPACGRPVGDGSGRLVRRSGLEVVLRDLAYLGFDAEWRTLRASDVGAPHRRERFFVIATAADAPSDGRDEGRAEPARQLRRPDAALGSLPTSSDADNGGRDAGTDLSRGETQRRDATDRASTRGIEWGAYAPAIRRWEHVLGRPAPPPTEPGRTGERLSPLFVEWLMGLPAGHVTAVPGLSRNAQLKALGNGVVPAQAEAAIRILLSRAVEGAA